MGIDADDANGPPARSAIRFSNATGTCLSNYTVIAPVFVGNSRIVVCEPAHPLKERSRLCKAHFTAVKHSTQKGGFKCVKQRLP
jgi:hypothetical protein